MAESRHCVSNSCLHESLLQKQKNESDLSLLIFDTSVLNRVIKKVAAFTIFIFADYQNYLNWDATSQPDLNML